MKKILFILCFALHFSVFSQPKYLTQEGIISFEASVPSFEEVAATNNTVTAILNAQNGEIAALAFVKGFRFKNALMEEHFNENYAESDEFPKALFKGILLDFDVDQINETTKSFVLNGELEFHGKKKQYETIEVEIVGHGEQLHLSGEFEANVTDFDIKIPKIVSSKVRDKVTVKIDLVLSKRN